MVFIGTADMVLNGPRLSYRSGTGGIEALGRNWNLRARSSSWYGGLCTMRRGGAGVCRADPGAFRGWTTGPGWTLPDPAEPGQRKSITEIFFSLIDGVISLILR